MLTVFMSFSVDLCNVSLIQRAHAPGHFMRGMPHEAGICGSWPQKRKQFGQKKFLEKGHAVTHMINVALPVPCLPAGARSRRGSACNKASHRDEGTACQHRPPCMHPTRTPGQPAASRSDIAMHRPNDRWLR
eukprot:jgi/Ulvmu1/3296/UM153_0008.1